jgi:hypothetical protein
VTRPSKADGLALLALVALVVVLFREPLLAGAVFFKRDIHLVWHPQIEGFVRAVAGGAWPLWDPSPAFGQPLLADPGAQVLYPPTWLSLVLPPWTYYTLFAFAHVLLSGGAFYALARRFPVAPLAAAAGAAVWILGGPFISLVDLWHHFASAAWIPAVFLMAERAVDRRRLRDVAALGLVLGLQILAGSADVCAMTLLALSLWVAVLHVPWRDGWRACRPMVAGGAVALALAVGLSAALWLTTLDVVSRSARRDLPEAVRTYWSVHPAEMVETMMPGVLGGLPLAPAVNEALGRGREPFLASLYLGLAALVLVGAGFVGGTGRHRYVLAGFGVGAALVALGQHAPAFDAVTTLLPPLRLLRYPVKAMILVGFAWAGLAALGTEAWRSAGASIRRRRLALLPLAALGAASALAATALAYTPETWRPFLALGEASIPTVLRPLILSLSLRAFLAAVVLVLVWTAKRGRVRPAVLVVALVAIAVIDLALAHPRPNPTAPLALYTHRPELLGAIDDPASARVYSYDYSESAVVDRRLGRRYAHQVARAPAGWTGEAAIALGMQMSLVPQTAGRWGVRQGFDIDYRGLQSESLSRLTHLVRLVEDRPGALVRLLRIGAVTHVVGLHRVGGDALATVALVPGLFLDPILVMAVPEPLPRIFVVGGARVAEGIDGLEALLDPGFEAHEEVLLSNGSPRPTPAGFVGSARVLEERADRVRIEANLSSDGYLVLVDTFDPGWRTSVDDQSVALLRANVAFRAVAVPAGRHVVDMVYRPPLTAAGLLFSGLTLLVALAALVRRPRPLA